MQDDAVTSILLAIDSPGGTVAGTLDVAQTVAEAATKNPSSRTLKTSWRAPLIDRLASLEGLCVQRPDDHRLDWRLWRRGL